MPIYEYSCRRCGVVEELYRSIAQRDERATCLRCGSAGERMISRPSTHPPDLTPYYDLGLGRRIESRSHLKRVQQELDVSSVGDRSTRPLHGTKGTRFSFPGKTVAGVPKSGAYA